MESGFINTHFRKTSQQLDIDRGFGDYVHLSLQEDPPILESKLSKGFPHVQLRIKSTALPKHFDLCRYNIARTRKVKDGKSAAIEGPKNGYYYEDLRVPVARKFSNQIAMIEGSKNNMIEVLIPKKLDIDSSTIIECFTVKDVAITNRIIEQLNLPFNIIEKKLKFTYPENHEFRQNVSRQVISFFNDSDWKGDGLDFDKL